MLITLSLWKQKQINMKISIHADGSLHLTFTNVEKNQLFDCLEVTTNEKNETAPLVVNKNLLKTFRANGKNFCKELFARYKFSEFDIKDIEDLRFKHRLIDVWSTFNTLQKRGILEITYNGGVKSHANRGNKYKFLIDISNQ